ncbi:hypothetical protein Leryth_016451 [Lithospermum erythrorhizon]|nr:hypothetical protein Leryth_016451 [Lithospermum erythrorhizon]
MYKEELYKKSWDSPLLSCVSQDDIPKILIEVHQGWCESHIGGDTMNFVKRCDVCQRMGSVQHQPTTP